MQISRINDWLQLAAAIGVLSGIFLVVAELRQNNLLARAETNNDLFRGWEEVYKSEMESDILELFIKSIENPDDLTPLEMVRVSSYLATILTLYQRQSSMFYNFGLTYDPSSDLAYAAEMYLGGRFARSWFLANRGWLEVEPEMYDILTRKLEEMPIQTKWIYMERLKSGMQVK